MNHTRRKMYEIASSQRGVLTRADLARAGVTRDERIGLVNSGALIRLGDQTFELPGLPPDRRRAWLAACVDGRGALCLRSGAALHGLGIVEPPGRPAILVPRGGHRNHTKLAVVHSTTYLPKDDLTVVDGIPCTTVARTLLGLAGLVPDLEFDDVHGAVDEAIRRGLASDKWLWWTLERLRRRGRPGPSVLERILTIRAGGEVTESWLEREFLRLCRRLDVPIPICQRRVRRHGAFAARVDFVYEELGIVVEVTGAVGHSSPEQRASDARRRNRLAMLGFLVLEFTYEQVVGCPDWVAAQVHEALATRSARHLATG